MYNFITCLSNRQPVVFSYECYTISKHRIWIVTMASFIVILSPNLSFKCFLNFKNRMLITLFDLVIDSGHTSNE